MALFGKKSNQQPSAPELPPELKPYYNGQSASSKVRRGLLRVVGAVAVIAILVVGGTLMWRFIGSHNTSNTTKPGTNQTAQAPKDNTGPTNKQNNTSSGTNGSNSNQATGGSQSTTTPSQLSPATSQPSGTAQGNGSAATPSQSPAPSTATTPAQSTNLTDTGPGDVAIAAVAVGAIGMVYYHFAQARVARSRR